MPLFDYASVQARAAEDSAMSTTLDSTGRNLCLDALSVMLDRWHWVALDDGDWDTLEAAISKALAALMTNTAIGQVVWRIGGIQANELLCDGSQYDRVDYPDLYDVLDSAYIVDADTFRVPDLAHKVMVGEGDGWDVGDTGGAEEHTLTVTEMPSHTHTYTPPTLNIDLESPGAPDIFAAGLGLPTATSSAGGDGAHNNMQPYEVVTPVIVAY